jgi:hypothetical protein
MLDFALYYVVVVVGGGSGSGQNPVTSSAQLGAVILLIPCFAR